jgi:hypothetical protein
MLEEIRQAAARQRTARVTRRTKPASELIERLQALPDPAWASPADAPMGGPFTLLTTTQRDAA